MVRMSTARKSSELLGFCGNHMLQAVEVDVDSGNQSKKQAIERDGGPSPITISGNRKAIEEDVDPSLNMISKLPVPILHHILCFLSQKEAFQTRVLSKSWLNIGSTRPKFDFRERDFRGDLRCFINFMDKTINTCLTQKLSVPEFRLEMSQPSVLHCELVRSEHNYIRMSLSLLIISALHHLDVKSFVLSFHSLWRPVVELPRNFFTAESLEKLSLRNCSLNKDQIVDVEPERLKSLSLDRVEIEDETLQLLLSTWHSIEDLVIIQCHLLKNIVVGKSCNLKHFHYSAWGVTEIGEHERLSVEISTQTIETIKIEGCSKWFHHHNRDDGNHLFPLLKSLYLNNVQLSSESFDCISCHFPVLEELSLVHCYGFVEYQLSSRSFKHLRIVHTNNPVKVDITIDAPNLAEFEYEGGIPKSISFEKTPVKLKSKVVVQSDANFKYDASSCCLELYECLKGLAGSQIFLDITISHTRWNPKQVKASLPSLVAARGSREPIVVEYLTIKLTGQLSTSLSAFINNMFCIWHPRNMAQWMYNNPKDIRANEHNHISEYLQKVLLSERIMRQCYLWKRDLEAASMERVFEDEERDKVRFRLKWTE